MSTYENAQIEPKKQFLSLLINLYFETATSLVRNRQIIDGQRGMYEILTAINASEISELKDMEQKLDSAVTYGVEPSEEETFKLFKQLSTYLHKHQFSELQMGIIPTSTLQSTTAKPENKPLNPNQSSRI
jgi:hypothetical protein